MRLFRSIWFPITLMLALVAGTTPPPGASAQIPEPNGPSYTLIKSRAPKPDRSRGEVGCMYFFRTTLGTPKQFLYFWYTDEKNIVQNPTPDITADPPIVKWNADETKSVPTVTMVSYGWLLEMSRQTHDAEASCMQGVVEGK